MNCFDIVIIGGGPAGYLAAERASKAGLKTAVIEKKVLGGTCLNEGCIPSKTLLNSAKIYEYALNSEKYGVTTTGAVINHGKVVARKNKVVKKLVAGISAKLIKQNVSIFNCEGYINGKNENGFIVNAGEEILNGKKIIIATGSVAIIPPIPGVKEGMEKGFVLTSKEILNIAEIPNELIVVGGGVIGLEMASYFASVGSKVSVIEMQSKIAGNTENEVSSSLQKSLESKGVNFYLNSKVTQIGENSVNFEGEKGVSSLLANKVLLSIGRRAAIQNIGLENINVHTEKGAIVTNEYMQTNISGVYAAGDVNGKSMLAHTAYREAEVAVNHILYKKDLMRYNAIPSVIYTNPEVACIGETLESAKDKNIPGIIVKLPMSYAGRYVAEVERGDGFCKLIVDKRYNCIIGAHIIGSYSSEMVYGIALMIETEMKIDNIKEIVFPHPTVSEIIRETLFEIE